VLLGLLLPAVSAIRASAQDAECKNNLRNLALATLMYTDDWDGSYPPAWVIGSPDSTAWCGVYYTQGGVKYMDVTRSPLWPYLQDKKVLRCKSFTASTVKYAGSGQISGYGINCQYVAGDPVADPNGMAGYALPAIAGEIRNPSQTILFADCARVKGGVFSEEFFVYPLYKHGSSTTNAATFHFRHKGHANVAFCDGRVESVRPLKLDPAGKGECGWMGNELMDRE
jgi:prepilin-type processing-associated H-X9-DG protein